MNIPVLNGRAMKAFALLQCGLPALLVSACIHGQAKTMPEVPLDMPAAPPRIVEVQDPAAPAILPLPEEPVRTPPPRPRTTPPPTRTEARPPEPPKEPPVETRIEDAKPPAPPLQTSPTQQEVEQERHIRTVLGQASGDLNRINYQGLNVDARTQFDTAKRFVLQAEEALKARNLVFAGNLAAKAAVLAAQLSGR